MFDPNDTIVALSSAAGPGARAIVRLSGEDAWSVLRTCFHANEALPDVIQRGRWDGSIALREFAAGFPAEVLAAAAPRTYTGQDLIEIHTLSSTPLVEALIAHCLGNGARSAQPGEFTMRAFLAGKLDLTQAEAVLGVIEAGSIDDLKTALAQLAGGMARPLHDLREELLALLAEVEAGLDFAEEGLEFISRERLLTRVVAARQLLENLEKQLEERAHRARPFRVVLTGPPNAGKSSLLNALAQQDRALVSPQPGTTRDYVVHLLRVADVEMELIDTAGCEEPENGDSVGAQAQEARRSQMAEADLWLACHDAANGANGLVLATPQPKNTSVLNVWTKCDVHSASGEWPQTSARTGFGLSGLRDLLAGHVRKARRPVGLAPSWSRCRRHLQAGIEHLRRVETVIREIAPAELLALELRLALDQVGEMVGAVYTDDLLDRIFSQFCIGK